MNYIDVFNGDADGICALIQLRRANPQDAQLVTGVKRDIELLGRINATADDHISVLDISFDKNREDVLRLLGQGASIDYFDHHYRGAEVNHAKLNTVIEDRSPSICTGLLVDRYIGGQFRAWALVAAFGDNMNAAALALGEDSGFDQQSLQTLQNLGVYINYNSYGKSLSDLFYHPDVLYQRLQPYDSPFDFIQQNSEIYSTLETGYREDIAMAETSAFIFQSADSAVVQFDNEKWARRVSGVYINVLANRFPNRAHAVITEGDNESCTVSIRAPLERNTLPADELARKFPSGGGRKGAAGINTLPVDQIDAFISTFNVHFSSSSTS